MDRRRFLPPLLSILSACARAPRRAGAPFILVLVAAIFLPAPGFSQAREAPPAKPRRIVSMNLCTDELLMRLVDPSRIASITYLSHQPVNAPLGLDHIAATLPVNYGLAEEVIRLRPDLVLAGQFTARPASSLLSRLGYRVEMFAPENSFADMRANIRRLGALVGEEARAEAVIADFDARLGALQARIPRGEAPVFADIGVNNYVAGRGTLYTEVINAAGYRTLGQALGFEGFRNVPLETLLTVRPALVSTATPWTSPPSLSTLALAHPALRALGAGAGHVVIPERFTTCGAPSVLGAVEILVNARLRQEAR